MIKLTHVSGSAENALAIFLIAGGPGLSSRTLRALDLLKRSFDLFYVDLPGCNGLPFDPGCTLASLSLEISAEIARISRRAIVLGHSFGGFIAANVALQSNSVHGLVCIATPFSTESQQSTTDNYSASKGSELLEAKFNWTQNPSQKTFAKWLSEYGLLYFSEHTLASGRELLMQDPGSYQLFQAIRGEAKGSELLIPKLKAWNAPKLFIAGAREIFLPMEYLKLDAESSGFAFQIIPDASHFVMVDQPEAVARSIEVNFATEKKAK